MVINGIGALLAKGRDAIDIMLKYLEAVFFKGPLSLSWSSLESSCSELDQDYFFLMAMDSSLVVIYKFLPTGRGDSRENPICWCRGFPNRTLAPRPFTGLLQFSWPSKVWPPVPQCSLPHFRPHHPVSLWCSQLMAILLESLE